MTLPSRKGARWHRRRADALERHTPPPHASPRRDSSPSRKATAADAAPWDRTVGSLVLVLEQRGDGAETLRHRLSKARAKQRQDDANGPVGGGVDAQPKARRGPAALGDELRLLVEAERPEAHVPRRDPMGLIRVERCGSLDDPTSLSAHHTSGGADTDRAGGCLAHLHQIGIP